MFLSAVFADKKQPKQVGQNARNKKKLLTIRW